jgi:signal-transduction protein with cAMP-binding, CBS, and nucleotidyltransferase domain
MSAAEESFKEGDDLVQVIEGLMAHRFGAVLICSEQEEARGVISKTDLVRAYLHGLSLEEGACRIMTAPVVAWEQEAFLWEALQHMFLKDVQRLFVHAGDARRIVGVLALSDAAQVRSGSCRACLPSRFITME